MAIKWRGWKIIGAGGGALGDGWPDYQGSGPMTIEGVTTDPVKTASPDYDFIRYRDLGNKWIQIDGLFANPNPPTGATPGSGDYLFTVPGGFVADPSEARFYTGSPDPGLGVNRYYLEGPFGAVQQQGGSKAIIRAIAYDNNGAAGATRVRLHLMLGDLVNLFISSGNYNLANSNMTYQFNFTIKVL